MNLKIAVLAGDGIGPEIMEQGVAVCSAIADKFGHTVSYKEAICGAYAIDEVGDPFPEDTFQTCMDADAVLFASVGDPKFDNNPNAKVRPEQGLLAMKETGTLRQCASGHYFRLSDSQVTTEGRTRSRCRLHLHS